MFRYRGGVSRSDDGATWKTYTQENGLVYDGVTSIAIDAQGVNGSAQRRSIESSMAPHENIYNWPMDL